MKKPHDDLSTSEKPMQTSLPPLNTKLPFPNSTSTDYAILKYVGSVSGHNGVFCGIQLFGELSKKGKNNGIINNIKYFDIDNDPYRLEDQCGLFVPLRKVLGWLNNNSDNIVINAAPKPDDIMSTISTTKSMSIDSPTNTATSANHIKNLEAQLQQRTLDLQDLYNQINELDLLLKDNEKKLSRKEEKFNNYKIEKSNEIDLLVGTIESLEKKLDELVKVDNIQSNNEETNKIMNENTELKKSISELQSQLTAVTEDNQVLTTNVQTLEIELSKERQNTQSLKISKDAEINRLRNIEMEKYKLELKIDTLNDTILEKDKLLDGSTNEINELKLKIKDLQNTTATTPTINSRNELDVYVPKSPVDPTAGRPNFCTFCDISGHSNSECPYEKDNIEMF